MAWLDPHISHHQVSSQKERLSIIKRAKAKDQDHSTKQNTLYRIYIIQNIHYTEYPLHRTLFLTSKNSPLDIQFPSLYSILFGLSSVDREWQVYYVQSCYRSLRLTHSSESQEIVEGEAGVAL